MMPLMTELDVWAVLPTIRVPTLVVQHADNVANPPAKGKYIAEHIPDAKYVELPAATGTTPLNRDGARPPGDRRIWADRADRRGVGGAEPGAEQQRAVAAHRPAEEADPRGVQTLAASIGISSSSTMAPESSPDSRLCQ